jgi:glutathione S-transferase
MPSISAGRLQEASLLTRAVENVFRKLIRLLVGRISLVKLQEMMGHIYVEETELKLRAESPGRNVPLTRLALSTGLDTRALVRIRERIQLGEPQYRQQFLSELTPESAVVEAWASRVRRSDDAEDASVLDYGSESAGFEALVRAAVPTRGLTTQSILKRLVATRSVEQDRERKRLRLLVDHFSPYLSQDEPNIVNAAFSAISNLISTIEHNVCAEPEDLLLQRQKWTFRLAPGDLPAFRQAMREMLERHEAEADGAIEPWEQDRYDSGLITAGVGFYYFEESGPAAS